MNIFPYILSLGTVAVYFLTEADKKRKYQTLVVGVCFLAAFLATYFRGALVAYLSWVYLPVLITAWMSGSIMSRIIELPKTLANLWARIKAMLNIA